MGRRGLSGGLWWGVVTAAALSSVPAARAASVIIADAESSPEARVEAAAVTFLLRQALDSQLRPVVPPGRLRETLFPGGAGPRPLTVAPEEAPQVLTVFSADRLVLWQVLSTKEGLSASGVTLGPDGHPLGRVGAQGARGEVAALARALAAKVSRYAPGPVAEVPDVGLAELRPFVDAQASLLAGDPATAARALVWASAKVAGRLPAARALLVSTARSDKVPAAARVRLSALAGEAETAVRMADQALAASPADPELKAARAQALLSAGRVDDAGRALTGLSEAQALQPAVAAARAQLAIARKEPPATVGALLAPALLASRSAKGTAPAPILALVAGAPPAAVSVEVEAMTVAAARRMAVSEAALNGGERYLLTDVATHALGSGDATAARTAGPLLRAPELSEETMSFAQSRIEAMKLVDDPALHGLTEEMVERQAASAAARARTTARAVKVGSPLARELLGQLGNFEALYRPNVATLTVADLSGSGHPAYSPFVPLPQVLRDALAEAAALDPFELPAVADPAHPVTEQQLGEEARRELGASIGGDVLLFGRTRVEGLFPIVSIELALVDPRRGTLEKRTLLLPGRPHHLVELAPWVWPALIVATLIAFLIGVALWVSYWRRGGIAVRVQWETDSRDELFCIAVSTSPEAPELGDVEAFRARLADKRTGQTAREAWKVGRMTEFRRLPAGRWYVSLYGVYTAGKQTIAINDDPDRVEVRPRKTTTVVFDLQHREAEFEIRVSDGKQPVAGARVWVDDRTDAAVETDGSGRALVKIAHGYHLLNIAARDVEVRRAYHVIKAKRHEMNINLEAERRREDVSRALERHGDELYEKL